MSVLKALNGQSIFDICLMTYGSLDYLSKLIIDNGIDSINSVPASGQEFTWDETFVTGQVSKTLSQILATSVQKNGSVLSVSPVQNQGGGLPAPGYYTPVNQIYVNTYMQTLDTQYVAGGGETLVTLTELIGATIVQITKETQPLKPSEFSLNINTGGITLTTALSVYETLYIIYTKMITG